jgi:hypothetical protein
MYRMVDCGTWDDPWFESLEPQGKLFFLYLLTNPRSTSCGAFEITPRKMSFETGIPQEQIETWLASWSPRVQWWPEHQIVFLKNFYRRQSNSEKVRINAAGIVAKFPDQVRKAIYTVYPEFQSPDDTLSIPYPDPSDKRNVTETETRQDKTETETPPKPPAGEEVGADAPEPEQIDPLFLQFWKLYPTGRGKRVPSMQAWNKLKPAEKQLALERLPLFVACHDWQKEGGRFVRHAERWIKDKGWKDDIPPDPVRAGPKPRQGGFFAAGQSIDEEQGHERQGNRHGAGDDYGALLADPKDGRAQRGVDGADVAENASGRAITAAYRTRPG